MDLELPESYFKYQLRGVVIHVGSSDSGHYYSCIKEGDKWIEFNDTSVRYVEAEEVMAEA